MANIITTNNLQNKIEIEIPCINNLARFSRSVQQIYKNTYKIPKKKVSLYTVFKATLGMLKTVIKYKRR